MWWPALLPSTSNSSARCTTLHSSAHGEAATRGGATIRDGAVSRPACSNSDAPRGSVAEVAFICSRSSHVGRFHTNSPASPANAAESFIPPLENISIGGRSPTALKKLYGARLTAPSALIVETQPIGRGATSALKGSCGRSVAVALGGLVEEHGRHHAPACAR